MSIKNLLLLTALLCTVPGVSYVAAGLPEIELSPWTKCPSAFLYDLSISPFVAEIVKNVVHCPETREGYYADARNYLLSLEQSDVIKRTIDVLDRNIEGFISWDATSEEEYQLIIDILAELGIQLMTTPKELYTDVQEYISLRS